MKSVGSYFYSQSFYFIIILNLNLPGILMLTVHKSKRKTTTPLPVLVSEARFLFEWSQADRELLTSAGLNWEKIESLPELFSHSESLYARCQTEREMLSLARKDLKEKFENGKTKRTLIAARIRFALEEAGSKIKIPPHFRHKSYSSILGDLNNLVNVCRQFEELLDRTGFSQRDTDSFTFDVRELQSEWMKVHRMELEYEKLRDSYLEKYHELLEVVQIIRRYAFELFPAGSHRRKGYVSQYWKSFKTKSTN